MTVCVVTGWFDSLVSVRALTVWSMALAGGAILQGLGMVRRMKRCEAEWTPAKAEAVQAVLRKVCGACPCEQGIPCPLFAPRDVAAELRVRAAELAGFGEPAGVAVA